MDPARLAASSPEQGSGDERQRGMMHRKRPITRQPDPCEPVSLTSSADSADNVMPLFNDSPETCLDPSHHREPLEAGRPACFSSGRPAANPFRVGLCGGHGREAC